MTKGTLIRFSSVVMGISLALASTATAKPPGHAKGGKGGKGNPHKKVAPPGHAKAGHGKGHAHKDKPKHAKKHFDHFDDDHVVILREYFSPYRSTRGLPPGIAKQVRQGKGLPPGWEKNFVRGRRLEDPVWNRLIPVPDDLHRRIRYQQPGRYYILNDRLVRVNPDNRTLLGSILLSELLD